MAKRLIYVIITKNKVHLFGSHLRAMKVMTRGERLGWKWEYTTNIVRTGAPHK